MEFHPHPNIQLPPIPDDVSIPQFMFDCKHPSKPTKVGSTPWLIDDQSGRQFGGEQLRKRVNGLSNALHVKLGLGNRNHIDYPAVIWATHQLGGVVFGANPDFSEQELAYQIKQANAKLLVVHSESLSTAAAAARDCGISDDRIILFDTDGIQSTRHLTVEQLVEFGLAEPASFSELKLKKGEGRSKLAFLSFSSGTTGRPKAVAISHYSLIVNVVQWAVHNKANENYTEWKDRRYRPSDVAIGVLPFYHIYGLVLNLHAVIHSAMSLVVVKKFNITSFLESIMRYRITHLFLVPPLVVQLCKNPVVKKYNIKEHVRMILCGAAPLTRELNEQLFEMFPDAHIGQAYGMTETCTATMAWPIHRKRGTPGSSGRLLPGVVARVVKLDGALAVYDEPGELWIKTPSVSLGYVNNEQATRGTFVDGWVRTGDEVVVAKSGDIIVMDRIKVRGFQVAPAELEGCLLEYPGVASACVVGVPHDYSGEVPLAFIALTAQAAERAKDPQMAKLLKDSIRQHVARQKVHYKHLTGGVEFISQIPVSPSGKLLRRIMRDQAKLLAANENTAGRDPKAKL
ncbi:phenylacetyl-CoA ligase [Coprinopsis marcescibilis]|uniref:Phenylacetyl-CoA ligase n=1 Tax=Coprinopsis marcescibilis TaxID=230819 RepID=A0A5C3KVC2_COPMA|nr:phenylacetyl-CoA ligase [Coprinopsis marcescibilis]